MRKRIRVNQLRIGMYVEDVERHGRQQTEFRPFLISTPGQVRELLTSHVRSVVIDVFKGADTHGGDEAEQPRRHAAFEASLRAAFSPSEISQARQCVDETKPHIRLVLSDARIKASFSSDAASAAVERIMATALDNAGAVVAVARLKERDEMTFLHSLAVSALMISFGRVLGHHEEKIRLLGIGGLVHDLGKMTLPDAILMKPGKLTNQEMELVRSHPQRGYDMLARSGQASKPVLDICRFHHERYDGAGYPGRIAGRQIPYVARLAAICDVYEALTTIRAYKRAFSQAEAVNIMMNSPGQFDGELLSTFISTMIISGTLR